MSECVQYIIEMPHFIADGQNAAVQNVLRLENLVDIPDPCYITRTMLWAQSPLTFPAGSCGDITVAVDPRSQYSKASGFPTNQFPTPMIGFLKTIGKFEGLPGIVRGQIYELPNPVAYRKSQGDSIVFAPELSGGYEADFFMGVSFLQDGDIAPPGEPLWILPLDTDSGPNNNISIRQMITGLGTAWSRIRIGLSSKASGCNVSRASVGVISVSGPNTVATPIQLPFVGKNGCNLAANGNIYSDWIDFPGAANLAFTFDMLNGPSNNHWAYKTTSCDSYYTSAVASSNSATMLGTPVLTMNRTHVIARIEVK